MGEKSVGVGDCVQKGGGEMMDDVTKLMEKWAKEDREFLSSINRKSKWLDRSVIIGLFALIILSVGIGNAPHTTVEVPVVDAALMQRYQVELDLTRKQRDDYKKQAEVAKKLLLVSNAKVTQYEQHLKALAESVPSQPVILEAVRKEASTPAGFRQAVARNFGAGIAKRVRVDE